MPIFLVPVTSPCDVEVCLLPVNSFIQLPTRHRTCFGLIEDDGDDFNLDEITDSHTIRSSDHHQPRFDPTKRVNIIYIACGLVHQLASPSLTIKTGESEDAETVLANILCDEAILIIESAM
ncbi:unnamed protein product [Protopolystoma xenopodis]|uniref:Uncharacterized protein n=1 Tax=Protopolystoma xenopodis TaxID=117903 RepID=A0A3S5B8M6_9PLAT|nr:unnamed protein product [Protopolystoma xenopodis]